MKTVLRVLPGLAVAIFWILPAVSSIVYQNDFSVRHSDGAIPSGAWRSVSYTPGWLAHYGENAAFARPSGRNGTNPVDGTDIQDNWIKGNNSCKAQAHVVAEDGNQFAVLFSSASTTARHGVIRQRLFNTFSSGVVTMRCDVLAPVDWAGYSPQRVCIMLGDEMFFSPQTDSDVYLDHAPVKAGISVSNGKRVFWCSEGSSSEEAKVGVWYRVIVAVDLDEKSYDVTFYELGTSRPTRETPTPARAVFSRSDVAFSSDVSNLSAIGLCGYGVWGGAGAAKLDQTAQFDNIRLSHDGDVFYENDFTVRRSRSLMPANVEGAYTADNVVTNTVKTGLYTAKRDLLAPREAWENYAQPVGVDGWRRQNAHGHSMLKVSDNGTTIRFTSSGYGLAAAPIGSTAVDGLVLARVDMLTPKNWNEHDSLGSVRFVVGDETVYNGNHKTFQNGYYALFNIKRDNLPYCSSSTGEYCGENPPVCEAQTWYRVEFLIDLDRRTYNCSLYRMGTSQPSLNAANGTAIWTANDRLPYKEGVTKISSFLIGAYYAPNAQFDNIKISFQPKGATQMVLVYSNSTTTRSVYSQDRHERKLTGTLAEMPVGQDGWKRLDLHTEQTAHMIAGDGNSAMAFNSGVDLTTYVAHDLGGSFMNGRLVMQVDLCAPLRWVSGGSGRLRAILAGDRFLEGNLTDTSEGFSQWWATGVGFDSGKIAAYRGASGETAGAWETSSATAEPGHWYRFVVTTDLDKEWSGVTVYDMGTEQPAITTKMPAAGTSVATFARLPLRRPMDELGGVSCVVVATRATEFSNTTEENGPRAKLDNLIVSHNPPGLVLSFR